MLDAVAADVFEPFEVLAGASMGNYRAAYSPHNVWLLCSADTTTLLDKLPHCSTHCKALYVHRGAVNYTVHLYNMVEQCISQEWRAEARGRVDGYELAGIDRSCLQTTIRL